MALTREEFWEAELLARWSDARLTRYKAKRGEVHFVEVGHKTGIRPDSCGGKLRQ